MKKLKLIAASVFCGVMALGLLTLAVIGWKVTLCVLGAIAFLFISQWAVDTVYEWIVKSGQDDRDHWG